MMPEKLVKLDFGELPSGLSLRVEDSRAVELVKPVKLGNYQFNQLDQFRGGRDVF